MKFSCWLNINDIAPAELKTELNKLFDIGVDSLLPCVYDTNKSFYKSNIIDNSETSIYQFLHCAKKIGFQVHAWTMIMRLCNKAIQEKYPHWFAYNRHGENSLDKSPYVDYYKWLCPFEEEVLDFLNTLIREIDSIDELDGIHLDYIRYPDVILPDALQSQYKLKQSYNMPEYDYCYHPKSLAAFKQAYGYEITQSNYSDEHWHQFRLKRINYIVEELHSQVKSKIFSAAVFPTPKMSAKMVRQDWGNWNLDAYYPMIYHGFYNQTSEWLIEQCKECLDTLQNNNKSGILVPGVYIVDYKNSKEFLTNVESLAALGIERISLFCFQSLNEELRATIKKAKNIT